jgi:glycosyltransferase involved in cell wall biosynthesis
LEPQAPLAAREIYMLSPGRGATAGGIGRFVADLATNLPAMDPSLRLRLVDTRGSGSILMSPLYLACALASVANAKLRRRVSLLHLNLASNGSAARKVVVAAFACCLRIPFIIHLHGGGFDVFYRSMPGAVRAVIRWMFARAARVVVLGKRWHDFLSSEVGLSPEKIEVIPNGVFVPTPARSTTCTTPPRILFLGRLHAQKGVTDLLEALSVPAIAELSWVATLAGDGDRAYYLTLARRYGLSDRIDCPGWVDNARVQALLASATMLVLPSHTEGLPMAVIEALAHAKPVVATSVGSIPDYLLDGESALLVPPAQPAVLAEAILALLRDPPYREQIGRRGHQVFLENFELCSCLRRWVRLYRDIAAAYCPGRHGVPDRSSAHV